MTATKSKAGQQDPKDFVLSFRRRSLVVSFLGFSFFAALANEGIRWLATWLNGWLGTGLPVFSVGPFFLAVGFMYTLRRWSLPAAARRADRALDFRDRLTSFVDIAGRGDVPAPIARAQGEETTAALTGIAPSRARPVPLLLCAGPLILVLSVLYPNFITVLPPVFQVAQYAGNVAHRPVDPEEPGSAGERSEGGPDSRPAPEEKTPEPPGKEDAARPESDDAPVPGNPPPDSPGDSPSQGGAPSIPHVEQPSTLMSTRTGEELSKVVDPLFSPGEERQAAVEELPAGAMVFRLLPEVGAGDGEGGDGESSGSLPARVEVDFDDIPEQYRSLVKRYFAFLGSR